jgi:hypothetical protein
MTARPSDLTEIGLTAGFVRGHDLLTVTLMAAL